MRKIVSLIIITLLIVFLSGCSKPITTSSAVLLAHYKFEEDLSDSVGNYGEGQVCGGKIGEPGGNITYTVGIDGKAVYLDGASGILLPNNLISTYQYSISLWLNAETLSYFTPVFFGAVKKDVPNEWLSIIPGGHDLYDPPSQLAVWSNYNNGQGWYDGKTGYTLETDRWYHIAVTVNNGNIKIYINGEKKFDNGGFPDLFTGKDALFALGVNYWDSPFKGVIDDLRVYNGVLTDSEVLSLATKQ
uniref:LamG domain-containing protein n=1 Tax=Dictyoglomus thermophilum TaxID=14 RepID=A0A7C3MIM5_DICTH